MCLFDMYIYFLFVVCTNYDFKQLMLAILSTLMGLATQCVMLISV